MAPDEVKFKTGNICRVYIKDFLTFDEVEVRPKPRLNFICGPNGTGKSTVLCAICICLGGKAAVTGRGKELFDFVKHNKEEALLEVEVYVEGEINVVIMRKINGKLRHTSWYLQGKEVQVRTVTRKIEELNIKMDNLCQFLPQDRVAAFAMMNNRELLTATEMAVGDASLHHNHQLLCDDGQQLVRMQEHRKELEGSLANAERRNARLKDVVENLDVKYKLELELKSLHTQRAWYLYDQKRKIHQQFKEELSKNESELQKIKESIRPVVSKINEKRSGLHQLKKTLKEKTEWVHKHQQTEKHCCLKHEKQAEALKDAKRVYQAKTQMEKQRRNEVLDYKRQLDVLVGQLQNLPDLNEADTAKRLKELTTRIHESSQSLIDLQGRLGEVCLEKEEKARTIKLHTNELATKQDVVGQRLELLRERNGEAYRATQWLQRNRDVFMGCVYPPICAVLNIKNEKYVRYIEDRVMFRDLVAFVCEDKNDVNLLKEEMDRQHLRVNIVYSNPNELGRYKPQLPITSLRKFGFDTYMLDCVEAPPAVLSFLCRNYSIHSVPIALSGTGEYNAAPVSLTVFYMGNSRYSRARSRYDNEVSTSIYPLRVPHLLHIILDTKSITQLRDKIAQLQLEIKGQEETMKGIKTEEEELSKNLESWRNEKRALASRKEERKMLDQRINLKRNQIDRHEENAIDLEVEKLKMTEVVDTCIRGQLSASVSLLSSVTNCTRGLNECLKVEGRAQVVAEEVVTLEQSAEEQRLQMEEMERSTQLLGKEVNKLKMEAQSTLNELKKLLEVASVKEITVEIRNRFQDSSLEETEKVLAEKDAHLACLVTATSTELQEYKERQKEVERLQKQLDEVQHKEENHHEELDGVKQRWLPHITQLVADISDRFSHFMSRMGCAGEVVLREAGDNFTQYGMVIRVKFRDHQRLAELTAQHQSGGERAVSTALYLLALQSLTSAPFRCVDEINQGMDPVNERHMLRMLMETEQNDDSSQYFFVTPKILPDINFSSSVNVMVVFNSPTTLSHRHFNIRRAIRRKQEAQRHGKA